MILEFLIRAFEALVRPRINAAYGRLILRRAGSVGLNVRVHGRITVTRPDCLTIGDHVRIGYGCFFFCNGGLSIGRNTQISRNVVIYTGNHDALGDALPYSADYRLDPVRIGDSVWIGMNAAILPGVTIGDGAVIGLGTVVTKDVPPGAVVVGPGQRVVKFRDMDRFADLSNDGRLFGVLWPDR
jgi:acetyltransferase-like isoleucine patch superfamily enzyme